MSSPAAVPSRLVLRLYVLRAMLLLSFARLLVRGVALRRWRSTLGNRGQVLAACPGSAADRWPRIKLHVRCVERAAGYLPGESRCLPKAMAVQWLLGGERIPSTLVMAAHARDRTAAHAYHAWVEYAGDIVIGHCERSDYRVMAAFSHGGSPAIAPTASLP